MIVKKAYNMANMMNIPILGIVENFSYALCPDCGKQIKIFGESHIDETAKELDLEVLAKVPLNPEYAALADAGRFYENDTSYFDKAVEMLEQMR
jgi:Mrp family chromosome partitioning ATPase